MPRDVAADLATILEAAALGLSRPPTAPKNLYLGPLPEDDDAQVPDQAVAVLTTGGPPPVPYIGQGRKAYVEASCQIRIRAAREDFAAGQTLAFGIMDALHLAVASPYLLIQVRESSPFYGGTDQSDRHTWAINVSASYIYDPP